jgi:hypothetical protein
MGGAAVHLAWSILWCYGAHRVQVCMDVGGSPALWFVPFRGFGFVCGLVYLVRHVHPQKNQFFGLAPPKLVQPSHIS